MTQTLRKITIRAESYRLIKPFTISRGYKNTADVVVVEINDGALTGRGECVPYARYGETLESVTAEIETIRPMLEGSTAGLNATSNHPLNRDDLQTAMHPGAARNAIDCALWDLEAKQNKQTVPDRLTLHPRPLSSAVTVTLDTPAKMAQVAKQEAAKQVSHQSSDKNKLVKIKLGGADGIAADIGRLSAIRDAVPEAALIVDVNEGWHPRDIVSHVEALKSFNIDLIEQPLPADNDDILKDIDLPFCADESVHDSSDLYHLNPGYTCVNIKLDKTGGLTEALKMLHLARDKNLKVMVGCMVASSLSMMPAYYLGLQADYVDLDGPLWLEKDHENGLVYSQGEIILPTTPLWGWD
ncbi:hypothetical protein IMCC14465_03660 [alpha proteobacterium IMCC14465]|uniref:Dipeptide epimerase n=1 Tax=alpha proteobacterium IMCC14465 TaxID=1220535 RepID=J9DY65_9PROT|nr:hypothetical protein IMCC14465_03660 [alpha proteobacterium IMCC14465]